MTYKQPIRQITPLLQPLVPLPELRQAGRTTEVVHTSPSIRAVSPSLSTVLEHSAQVNANSTPSIEGVHSNSSTSVTV